MTHLLNSLETKLLGHFLNPLHQKLNDGLCFCNSEEKRSIGLYFFLTQADDELLSNDPYID